MEKLKIIDLGLAPEPPKKTILVIDDEVSMHSLMFDTLSKDYNLFFQTDGKSGYSKAIEVAADLILMDMMMPGTNGYDGVCLLGSNDATKNIPVIVITARHFDQTTIQLLKAERNVAAFINKPFRPHELRDMIKKALKI